MKIIILISAIVFTTFLGCGRNNLVKLSPVNNNDSLKVLLNVTRGEDMNEPKGDFSISFQNDGRIGLRNCEITLNNKYKHTFEGLFDYKNGALNSSDFRAGEKYTFIFSDDIKNDDLFGIPDGTFAKPDTIEFSCDRGKIIWKW